MRLRISYAVAVIGIVLLFIGMAVPAASLQFAGSGGSSTGSSYTWSMSGTVSLSPSTIDAGSSTTISVDVASFSTNSGQATTLGIYANGVEVKAFTVSSTGMHTYDYSTSTVGSTTILAKYIANSNVPPGFNILGSASLTVQGGKPTITDAYASPNPITAGNSTTFHADVNWNGQTGTVQWSVNGGTAVSGGSGNTYTFESAGSYTVVVTAQNSYGTATSSFTLNVQAPSSQQITNAGHFYFQVLNGSVTKLTSTTNVVFKFASFPANLTVFYVEDNGTTQNLEAAYVTVNGGQQIYVNTQTTVGGHKAYMTVIELSGTGTYTLAGYLQSTSSSQPPVQLFSIAGSAGYSSPATSTHSQSNYYFIGIGAALIAVAAIAWRRGL